MKAFSVEHNRKVASHRKREEKRQLQIHRSTNTHSLKWRRGMREANPSWILFTLSILHCIEAVSNLCRQELMSIKVEHFFSRTMRLCFNSRIGSKTLSELGLPVWLAFSSGKCDRQKCLVCKNVIVDGKYMSSPGPQSIKPQNPSLQKYRAT